MSFSETVSYTHLDVYKRQQYKLGDYISDSIITVGYEDFNYRLETSKGKYCVKIFNRQRSDEECKMCIRDRCSVARVKELPVILEFTSF